MNFFEKHMQKKTFGSQKIMKCRNEVKADFVRIHDFCDCDTKNIFDK